MADAKHTPGPYDDDPHVDAVVRGILNGAFDRKEGVTILESCGYSRAEGRRVIDAAIARATGEQ